MGSLTISSTVTSLNLIPTTHNNNYLVFKFSYRNKFKSSPVCFSCNTPSNPINPRSRFSNVRFNLNPLVFVIPILQNIKGIAYRQTKRWVSQLHAYSAEAETALNEYSGSCLQNGTFGVALLSVTTNAKVRISPFVATLAANPTFVSGLVAWMAAQSIKIILNFFVERKWDLRLLFASGGMPSSHSALCTALTTSVALCHGVADSLFPVCLGFSLIVMYDAIGVRRHAGMQAEVLNVIIEDLFQGHPISQRKLKELLGHTPSQVLAGALLGMIIAYMCCQGCLAAT
ncbi:uncharacterized protein LOC120003683 [Tripterygium wilfordii]|uniref:uncharacterized protein LOC120003683 n=1 Tax=Tripterygium wilfordii TaxID=458696 RepID=UPI0018F85261|nr:uncharacterized protein LOC120003683 [Tripterygium wilfordii]